MAIKVKIGSPKVVEPVEEKPVASVELIMRKTLNGDIYISDHTDIDIIILKNRKKRAMEII